MSGPLLIIDTNYLCHRAWHSMGDLAYGDSGTGAIFGVLKDIISLQDEFKTNRCAFAFDSPRGLRREILPTYKSGRKTRHEEETEEERQSRLDFYRQIVRLQEEYLPMAGFRNVFSVEGFEGDDIIASIAASVPDDDEGIIVSRDKDLWQCLRHNVWSWNPHKHQGYTAAQFKAEWGVKPKTWAKVKALAGDGGDDVPGVPGVGEKTAARWLRGELGAHTQAAQKLAKAKAIYERNMKLVALPFEGTPSFEIVLDEVTEERWSALADKLGMKSLKGQAPRGAQRRRPKREGGFGFTEGR